MTAHPISTDVQPLMILGLKNVSAVLTWCPLDEGVDTATQAIPVKYGDSMQLEIVTHARGDEILALAVLEDPEVAGELYASSDNGGLASSGSYQSTDSRQRYMLLEDLPAGNEEFKMARFRVS